MPYSYFSLAPAFCEPPSQKKSWHKQRGPQQARHPRGDLSDSGASDEMKSKMAAAMSAAVSQMLRSANPARSAKTGPYDRVRSFCTLGNSQ